uniref:Uncharacterized protein n=1 Tax=Oryza meridionalis TaxID=40149 RepID=A0A0E0C4U8_9ORYZ
ISRRRRQQQQQIAAKNCTRSQLPTAGQVVADLSSRSRRFRASRARAGHRAVVNEQRRLRLEASGRAATSQLHTSCEIPPWSVALTNRFLGPR